jgi:pimeloyl-ACP methyl ester carboxylesterase
VLRRYHASARLCDPRAFHRNGVDLVAASRKEDLASRMAAIDRPRAYVYGSPRGTGSHSRDLLTAAGIEPVDVRDAGHWPFLDQHEIFVTKIRAFLGCGGRGEESASPRSQA